MKIPLIDLHQEQQDLIRDLHQALRDPGFIYVRNHGAPPQISRDLMALAHRFFAMDQEFKDRIHMKRAGPAWRGWFPAGAELTAGRPDLKEGLYFGTEHPADHPMVQAGTLTFGQNQWPVGDEWQAFPVLVQDWMKAMQRVGETLLQLIARGLQLPGGWFTERFGTEPTCLFRIFSYPPGGNADEFGVGEHTDMGFLTMLLQDNSGGLEVCTADGRWIAAPPVPGTLLINIGDMLEYWTRGIYRATPHRVRNTGKSHRLSLPFFLDPGWQMSLRPIPESMLPPESPGPGRQRWDGLDLHRLGADTTYGQFVSDKIRGVFPWLAGSRPG